MPIYSRVSFARVLKTARKIRVEERFHLGWTCNQKGKSNPEIRDKGELNPWAKS